jgi:phosphoserine phosphatase RsbU/P
MSIAVKLILATSVVVAGTVMVASWKAGETVEQLAETYATRLERSWQASFDFEVELIMNATAQAAALPMVRNEFSDLKATFKTAVARYGDKSLEAINDPTGEQRSYPKVIWAMAWLTDNYLRLGDVNDSGSAAATPSAPTDPAEIASILRQLQTSAGKAVQIHPHTWVRASPIVFDKQPLGFLWLAVSTEKLDAEIAATLASSHQRATESRRNVWLFGGGILLFGVLLAAAHGWSLARPIGELTEQAARIAGGDLSSRVPTTRRDELGALAVNFNFMADRIGLLLEEQAEKVALEHEMSLARSVQQAMLPPHSVEHFAQLKVAGYCAPASSCGGDWWMYRKMSDDRMLIVVGDATGHGIHSAMIAATARGAVEALAALDERLLTPEQVLRAIDSAIRNVGDHHVLMTAFAALFDCKARTLQYANAGQNFPYIVRSGLGRTLEDAVILATSGNPLGDREIPVEIRGGVRELRPGDLFVCFTDGLVERANHDGDLFGDRRLLRLMRGQAVGDDAALVALRERLVSSVESYAGGEVASDDITFVMCQYDPPVQEQRRAVTA